MGIFLPQKMLERLCKCGSRGPQGSSKSWPRLVLHHRDVLNWITCVVPALETPDNNRQVNHREQGWYHVQLQAWILQYPLLQHHGWGPGPLCHNLGWRSSANQWTLCRDSDGLGRGVGTCPGAKILSPAWTDLSWGRTSTVINDPNNAFAPCTVEDDFDCC